MFLLFGIKRYGDWLQAKISKLNYMFLQTKDRMLQLYLILLGAPIILDKQIYNYIPPNNLTIDIFRYYFSSSDHENTEIIKNINDDNTINIYGIDTKISRNYLFKYLKYKYKYIKLKEKLS